MKLSDRFDPPSLRQVLLTADEWHQYPPIADRAGWNALDPAVRHDLVARAEPILGTPWPSLPATLFMEFRRDGNRARYEQESFARRRRMIALVLAECAEAEGRFLDEIVNGIWAICEESYWDVPAHNRYATTADFMRSAALPNISDPVVALFSAETGSLLAYTLRLLATALDQIDPVISYRIRSELDARLLTPFLDRDDWWWLGLVPDEGHPGPPNNWNPWIISNILAITLLVEQNEERRVAIVHKALRGLDAFLEGYGDDGGCDEGVTYWGRAGGSVFDCLDVLDSASNGAVTVWDEPRIAELALYPCRVHIGDDWYVNFADGSARSLPDTNVLYNFGAKTRSEPVMQQAVASTVLERAVDVEIASLVRGLRTVFRPVPDRSGDERFPLIGQSWMPSIEVLTAREREGDVAGLFMAVKGGHNGESHNHNDIGSFVVGLDGRPVIIDVGVERYTRKTFSSERYDIWTMQSAYHNLPLINGHQQSPGREFAARETQADLSAEYAELRLDIAGAWAADVGLDRWERKVRLDRAGDAVVMLDDAWTMREVPESLVQTLMAAGDVDPATPGLLRVAGQERDLLVEYDAGAWQVATERIEIDDPRLAPVWGAFVTRVLLTCTNPQATGSWAIRFHP